MLTEKKENTNLQSKIFSQHCTVKWNAGSSVFNPSLSGNTVNVFGCTGVFAFLCQLSAGPTHLHPHLQLRYQLHPQVDFQFLFTLVGSRSRCTPLITAIWNLHTLRTDSALAIKPDDMLASVSHVLAPCSSAPCPMSCVHSTLYTPRTPWRIHHNKEHQRDSFRLTLGCPMLFDPARLCGGTIVVS